MIKQRLLSVVLLLLLLANVHALKIIALGDPLASSSGFNFQDESPLGSFVVGVGKTGSFFDLLWVLHTDEQNAVLLYIQDAS